MTTLKPLIALDGHAAAGSGTACRAVAEYFAVAHIDVGKMYRELALRIEDAGFRLAEDTTITQELVDAAQHYARLIDGKSFREGQLYSDRTGVISAITSPIPEARAVIRKRQLELASNPDGLIMEGRDITSVVMRDTAHCRIFLTANLNVRAQRRFNQLTNKGQIVNLDTIREEIHARDIADENRAESPLVCLPGVIRVDNSNMDAAETQQSIIDAIEQSMAA